MRGHRPRLQLYQSVYFGNRFSMLISSAGSFFRYGRPVVVNPVQRPRKMIVIHKTREIAAAARPAGGALASLSHRCTDRAAVNSKMSMLIPANSNRTILEQKKKLW